MMKTATLVTVFALSMTGATFAQTTGPSGQQDTNKPGMANPGGNSGMSTGTGTTRSDSMSNPNTATQTTPGSTMGPSGQTPKANTK